MSRVASLSPKPLSQNGPHQFGGGRFLCYDKTMTSTKTEAFVNGYGPTWRSGVLIDNTDRFIAAGGRIRNGITAMWAVMEDGTAHPVVCGFIITIRDEDGISTGRCGCNVAHETGACEKHAAIIAEWREQTEDELIAWERAHDDY